MSEAWTPGLARAARQALDANPRRVVIVGAGGWIGKATLELLADALGDRFSGRVAAFGSSDRELDLGNGQPVLTMTRMAFDAAGDAIEFGDHAYRAEDYTIDLMLDER